jgi:hypothetical protein
MGMNPRTLDSATDLRGWAVLEIHPRDINKPPVNQIPNKNFGATEASLWLSILAVVIQAMDREKSITMLEIQTSLRSNRPSRMR